MEFVGVGFMELLLLASSGGVSANDVVSLLSPEDYFAARSISANAKELTALARKNAPSPKARLQQLLAIRWLGENPAKTRNADEARALLEEIAAGKKAQDEHGFARAHARRALALLDGKAPPLLAEAPARSLQGIGLKWVPTGMAVAGGIELRADSQASETALAVMRKAFAQFVPARDRKEFYGHLEKTGNVRVDRAVVAARFDDRGEPQQTIIRFTGACDGKRLAAHMAETERMKFEERRGSSGETVLVAKKDEFGWALLGDSDYLCLIDSKDKKPLALLDEVLAVKAGKQKNLAEGPLAKLLEQVPGEARQLFVGNLPPAWQKDLTTGKKPPFRAFPGRVLAHSVRGQKQVTLSLQGALASKEEATAFKEDCLRLKQLTLASLGELGGEVPKEQIVRLKEMVAGVKVETDGVTARACLSADHDALLQAVLLALPGRREQAPEKP